MIVTNEQTGSGWWVHYKKPLARICLKKRTRPFFYYIEHEIRFEPEISFTPINTLHLLIMFSWVLWNPLYSRSSRFVKIVFLAQVSNSLYVTDMLIFDTDLWITCCIKRNTWSCWLMMTFWTFAKLNKVIIKRYIAQSIVAFKV